MYYLYPWIFRVCALGLRWDELSPGRRSFGLGCVGVAGRSPSAGLGFRAGLQQVRIRSSPAQYACIRYQKTVGVQRQHFNNVHDTDIGVSTFFSIIPI